MQPILKLPKLLSLVAKKIPTKWYEMGALLDKQQHSTQFETQTNNPVLSWFMHGVCPIETKAEDSMQLGDYYQHSR